MVKKRGQITIFLILGIVLLFAFGFLFFVTQYFGHQKATTETQTEITKFFKSESFKIYTSDCLKVVSRDALVLMGKQGGNIYVSQGGEIIPEKYITVKDEDNKNYSVSYGIIWDPDNADYTPPNVPLAYYPPDYPITTNDFSLYLYLGNNNLPYLCQIGGPNEKVSGEITPKRTTCDMPGIMAKSGYGPNSIQEQLSNYIAKKLKECINFSDIPGLEGEVIDEGNYQVNVTLGEDDISVLAEVPLTIKMGDKTFQQKARFSQPLNIRLKKIYTMAHMIVEADKKVISFNKKNNTELIKELKDKWADPSISVDIFRPLSAPGNYDDIVKIIDPKSDIPGKPFVFRFVIENRFPALDLSYEPITNPYKEKYDIVVATGQKIVINPEGYDPDEDELNYSYSGWRQDYYTIFNVGCCKPNGDINCSNDYTSCLVKKDEKTYNWTQSPEFKLTERKASYTTEVDYTDLGLHLLNITVYDNIFSDWQIIRLLVVDTPIAFANGYNNYTDINNNLSSIEDPYHLNATGSASIMLPIEKYEWADSVEPFSLTGGPILRLPETNYTIEDIKTKHFAKTMDNGLNHTITLKASNLIIAGEYKFNVTVHKCLPHSNAGTAPWPYNNLGIVGFDSYSDIADPFMADHTCCKDDYSYEPATTQCYEYTEYGTYQYIKNNPLTDSYLPGTSGVSQEPIATPSGYQNDVYKREFTRNCSGDRGNTCTGERDITVTFVEACHNECERPGSFSNSNQATVPGPISCQNVGAGNYVIISGEGFNVVGGRCSENSAIYSTPWHTYAGDSKVRCKYACSSTGCNQEVDCECKPEYASQGYCYYSIGCIAPESCHPIETTLMCKSGSWQYDARCDDCGHVCDLNGYIWYNPYCECVQSGSCPDGYEDLGQTSDCAKCCGTNNPP